MLNLDYSHEMIIPTLFNIYMERIQSLKLKFLVNKFKMSRQGFDSGKSEEMGEWSRPGWIPSC